MRKIQIVTDSACDIPKEYEEKYGIRILSFPITVGEESFLERRDFEPDDFYRILESSPKIPSTAQYTAHQFGELYEELYGMGITDVIYVTINAKSSSTNGNAHMAKKQFFEEHPEAIGEMEIYIVDSQTYSMGYGLPVIAAAKKAQKGAPVSEILAYLEDWFNCCRVVFAPYSLEFVKKSGRVSCAAAFVGELMGLKPIIEFENGEAATIGKVRGDKAVVPALLKKMQQEMIPHTPYIILEGSEPSYADAMEAETAKLFGTPCTMRVKIGAAISINAGHKILGIVYKGKPRK
ncbi:MAG: DegV family protein [Candidatus Merdivicinus sp.]|jgi:DegV family protein with EDD domain